MQVNSKDKQITISNYYKNQDEGKRGPRNSTTQTGADKT